MENASKALTIAGSILIAVLVLGTLVYVFQRVGDSDRIIQDQKLMEQIAEFNREYESYQKSLMRGTDVVSVINMANNNNVKKVYDDEGNILNLDAKITTKLYLKTDITDKENNIIMKKDKSYTIGSYEKKRYNERKYIDEISNADTQAYDKMFSDDDALKQFKRLFFKCTKIGYSDSTGLVNYLEFEEINVGDIPGY